MCDSAGGRTPNPSTPRRKSGRTEDRQTDCQGSAKTLPKMRHPVAPRSQSLFLRLQVCNPLALHKTSTGVQNYQYKGP
jgi:hypothetical protein